MSVCASVHASCASAPVSMSLDTDVNAVSCKKTNDVNEEMDSLEPNATQRIRSRQVEMQSICE
eukprot:11157359-Lingulodinium_polyedra.AAC.1